MAGSVPPDHADARPGRENPAAPALRLPDREDCHTRHLDLADPFWNDADKRVAERR